MAQLVTAPIVAIANNSAEIVSRKYGTKLGIRILLLVNYPFASTTIRQSSEYVAFFLARKTKLSSRRTK